MTKPDYLSAHKHSNNHRDKALASNQCGCFYCTAVFQPPEIEKWIDKDEKGVGQTALCPRCGIDSVIGSKLGYPITVEFLREMQRHWFS
ncbi:MAG: cytoplasmic protein [Candidatus Brocadia sp.]|nr:cytoplasmic protein [Candidatus Brocadia sp.]